ncbi:unnamed protein product [Euphydryas editha]|uniref:Uncharacterized protein n=1 Tax=Euphydryas editha TaxID=104508 RepID=A0AAU9V3H8_EUPED|nr:unnamed protein product [Euphydryas editha]
MPRTEAAFEEVLLFCFNCKKSEADHIMLIEAGENALTDKSCRNKPRPGQLKNLKTMNLRHYSMKNKYMRSLQNHYE